MRPGERGRTGRPYAAPGRRFRRGGGHSPLPRPRKSRLEAIGRICGDIPASVHLGNRLRRLPAAYVPLLVPPDASLARLLLTALPRRLTAPPSARSSAPRSLASPGTPALSPPTFEAPRPLRSVSSRPQGEPSSVRAPALVVWPFSRRTASQSRPQQQHTRPLAQLIDFIGCVNSPSGAGLAPDLSAAERVTGAEIPGVLPREPRSRHRAGGTPSIRLVMPPASFGAWWSPILGQHFGRLSRPSEGGSREYQLNRSTRARVESDAYPFSFRSLQSLSPPPSYEGREGLKGTEAREVFLRGRKTLRMGRPTGRPETEGVPGLQNRGTFFAPLEPYTSVARVGSQNRGTFFEPFFQVHREPGYFFAPPLGVVFQWRRPLRPISRHNPTGSPLASRFAALIGPLTHREPGHIMGFGTVNRGTFLP
mgnify:CR=1 FL=1